ncbi:TlpA disulfide reductase family protein [Hydrogenophaga sp. 5NK40-0174]|uniref:TlpA family protein disulfide reductase n=1 Tax=Hydrogenophaga sp. 5NK40-0174 TaxID=3127649 RepID=UPI0031043DA2
MKRRTMVAAGAAAAAAGLAAGWWRYSLKPVMSTAEATFWASRFVSPDGAAMPMEQYQGKPMLLNFWATWCPPCVEELPMIDVFFREQAERGRPWHVLGLAVDKASAVRTFLARQPVTFDVAVAGFAGSELGKQLGNDTGSLPFSVVFNADGQIVERKLGKLDEQDLQQWAAAVR